eukprot:SAG11_NODE_30103_length_304_cov_0.756098_1_plen_56_part_01
MHSSCSAIGMSVPLPGTGTVAVGRDADRDGGAAVEFLKPKYVLTYKDPKYILESVD